MVDKSPVTLLVVDKEMQVFISWRDGGKDFAAHPKGDGSKMGLLGGLRER